MAQDYCSILTQKLKVDGAGTAPCNIKYFLFIETAKPWPENEKSLASYPSFAYDLAQGSLKIHLLSSGTYSKYGFTKILFFQRSPDNVANYSRKEYHVPTDQIFDLIHALFKDNSAKDLQKFENYNIHDGTTRDLFMCGHLAKDYCCGTFGEALYQFATTYVQEHKESNAHVKIWQTSHLKGHKFAPTTIDFPEGRFWAHLTNEILVNQVLPLPNVSSLEGLRYHIRGLAGTNNFGQIAEREFLLKYGPSWIAKRKTITVEQDPDNKNSAQVTLTFEQEGKLISEKVQVSFLEEKITVSDHACGTVSVFKQPKVEFL